jgi:hypothetical protein
VLVAGAVTVLTATNSYAQSRRALEPRTPATSQWEQWRDPVPVSGGLRVGITAEPGTTINPSELTVWLPSPPKPLPPSRVLCVDVSSQDGRYIASLEYDVRGEPAGPVALKIHRSRWASELQRLSPSQLAILARIAEACGRVPKGPGPFLLASWDAQAARQTVSVLLNSRLPTSIVAEVGKRPQGRYACERLTGITTAFNLRCNIPVAAITPDRTFKIEIRDGDTISPPVELPLALP